MIASQATAVRENPLRYSLGTLLIFTAILFVAQHNFDSAAYLYSNTNGDFFVDVSRGQLSRQIAYLALGALGIVGLRFRLKSRPSTIHWNVGMIVPVALLMAWCALSISWAFTPSIAAKRLFVTFLMFAGSLGVAVSWTRSQIVKFIALSSGVHVALGILGEIVYGSFKPWSAEYRFAGSMTANEEGYLCMVLVIAALCCVTIQRAKGAASLLYWMLAALGLTFMLFSRCRGALLSLGVALLFYFFLVLPLQKRILTALVLATVAMGLIMSGVGAKVADTLNRGGEGTENLTGPGPHWEQLMTYVAERPWIGRGYESFWTPDTVDDVFEHQHWPVGSAHSQYVEGLLTIGRIGVALHTLSLLAGIFFGIRLYRATRHVVFFMGASLCCIYLVGGYLEAILIVKPSAISFYLALLLCLMMFREDTEQTGSLATNTALASRPTLPAKRLVRQNA